MSPTRYFAYGSNLDADQMRVRAPSSRPLFRARLAHHRLDFTHFSRKWQGGAADVVAHFGETVWGVVYTLEPADLDRLDGFEGGYARIELTVEDDAGAAHRVTSYSVRRKSTFRPTREYRDKMLHWGERWELPRDYLSRLRALRSIDE